MDKKKSKQQDVLVIGAGASGMMTAITAARRGLSVTVLEHMDKPGKKILATGNGKCNFTNLKMSPRCYYGDHGLVQEILKQFTVEDTLAFFREIGIWPRKERICIPKLRTGFFRCGCAVRGNETKRSFPGHFL